ncbi:MAG: hypothetical protein ACK5MA_07775, partial [Parachlamydiaceae bacterium]
MESNESLFQRAKVSSTDPRFLKRVFFQAARSRKEKEQDAIAEIAEEEYGSLSRRYEKSEFQDASLARNLLRARRIADRLITDQGELNMTELPLVLQEVRDHAYFLGPGWEDDAPRQEHILAMLNALNENKAIQRALRLISRPESNKIADDVIRHTLLLHENSGITDALARKAALSALLCQLRQNVGSCFATAPAIIVQKEQPEQFLKDIDELLSTGRLKRVAGGVEYSAPLAHSFGSGNLKRSVIATEDNYERLALSPGILNGLESVALVNASGSLKERVEASKQIVMQELKRRGSTFPVSAEELLRGILFAHFGIGEKDLEEYANRPRLMVQTSLLMSAPLAGHGMGGKTEQCSSFLLAFEKAKIGFKVIEENALLKSWEYTLASFAETKPGFTRWNMYASLGFNSDEPGGIGAFIYGELKEKLDRANRKVQEMQADYEMVYSQLKFIEGRMRNASTEKEAHWLRIEYETKRNEFHTLEEVRNREHFKAGRYANLLSEMIDAYDELFPNYFQEVYDPDMHDVQAGPYEDSPAGFRLLYKHGRKNTGQWTLIYTPNEFIESLVSFFSATEIDLEGRQEFEGLQQDISDLVTGLIQHVRKDEFIESAFYRMAKAYQTAPIQAPLKHLDKIDKKPWAYTSGGTMDNLMGCYFKLGRKPFVQDRWVENEMELLVFLLDSIKQMPPQNVEEVKTGRRRLLAHSPTHAFTIKGGYPEMEEALSHEAFTYTYVRDQMVAPHKKFIERMTLSPAMSAFLFDLFLEKIPREFRLRFQSVATHLFGERNPLEFRSALTLEIEHDRMLYRNGFPVLSKEVIDGVLFETLPLVEPSRLESAIREMMSGLPGLEEKSDLVTQGIEEILSLIGNEPFITSKQLQSLCKALLCRCLDGTSASYNYPLLIANRARAREYAMPITLRC